MRQAYIAMWWDRQICLMYNPAKTYSTPSKCCTTCFLQEATQLQNCWPPRSYKRLSPRTKSFLKCTCQSRLTECSHVGKLNLP